MTAWIVVGVVAAGTYAMRASLIMLIGRTGTPAWLDRALPFAGPAVIAALVAPALLAPSGSVDLIGLRFVAALVAGVVAWRTHSIPLTLLAGLGIVSLGAL